MFDPIVRTGSTPEYVWAEFEERSAETHYRVEMRCPVCDGEIQAFVNGLNHFAPRCLSCKTAVHIFQVRHLTETVDRRVIYAEALDQRVELFRLNVQCLSCEQPLQDDESCQGSCRMQTYLVLEVVSKELYVKRWIHHPNVPREGIEILIRQHFEIEGEKPQSVCIQVGKTASRHAVAHTDIAGQILEYLRSHGGLGKTGLMIKAINCSTQGFKVAIDKLIRAGLVRKVKHGIYELINHKEHKGSQHVKQELPKLERK